MHDIKDVELDKEKGFTRLLVMSTVHVILMSHFS